MLHTEKIVIAMPAFNEEAYIGTMVIKARKNAISFSCADDGSTDATSEIAGLLALRCCATPTILGKGAAVRTILTVHGNSMRTYWCLCWTPIHSMTPTRSPALSTPLKGAWTSWWVPAGT
jgi:hypothetical protein